MKKPRSFENARLGLRIRELRRGRNMTMKDVAEAMGVSQPAISQWEAGRDPPSRKNLVLIAKVLGVSVASLLAETESYPSQVMYPSVQAAAAAAMPIDVPVYGTAVGGDDGDFRFNGEILDYVRRPPGVLKLRTVYALWVTGSSMAPWNDDGDLIYVAPARPAAPGDYVVVEMHGGAENEPGVAMVKKLVNKTATTLRLGQYNPAKEFSVPLSKVKAVHKVLSLRELLGA